ncbi:MAG TPA: hypothetical protein VIG91_09790 [Terriglobales bacterium]
MPLSLVLCRRVPAVLFAHVTSGYRPYVPEHLLLPPGLREWRPKGHLAFLVSDSIEKEQRQIQ